MSHPSLRFLAIILYVISCVCGTVLAFSIGEEGALSAVAGSPFATGSNPGGVAISPNGSYLYVTNGRSDTVSAFLNPRRGCTQRSRRLPIRYGLKPIQRRDPPTATFST